MQFQFRSSPLSRYVLAAYALLVAYASLYPFSGWQLRDVAPWAFVTAPLPQYLTRQDITLNALGYVPLGVLMAAALMPRLRNFGLIATVLLASSAFSFAMEALQTFLPLRISSNVDWGLNSAGALLGAVLATLLIPRLPAASRIYAARHRWFTRDASFGLALLLAWPLAQLYPQPVLFGLGNAFTTFTDLAVQALEGLPMLAEWLRGWRPGGLTQPQQQMLPVLACATIGLLLGALAERAANRSARALCVLAVIAAGCATTTLSSAMSYGPVNAFAWLGPLSATPLLIGTTLACLLCLLPPRLCATLGLVAVLVMLGLINRLADDPYYTIALQAWQQGRWIRLHGVTEWLALAWPYAVALYLVRRVARVARHTAA